MGLWKRLCPSVAPPSLPGHVGGGEGVDPGVLHASPSMGGTTGGFPAWCLDLDILSQKLGPLSV